MSLKPTLPSPGDKFSLFGITGTVAFVTAQDDWTWSVEVEVQSAGGSIEGMTILVPTDFRTDNGQPAYGL